jgi:hypothetical protein
MREGPARKERVMTLLRDPEVRTEMRPIEDVLEREAPVERPAPPRTGRIHWLEWLVAVAFLVGMSALAIWMVSGEEGNVVVEESSPLVLSLRLTQGVAYTPEFVGLSGGDLPVIESSPLVLGVRLTDGTVMIPEYVGLSGGDLPVIESSALVLGVRLTDGTVFVPEYVGFNGGDAPFIESSPWILGPRHLEGVTYVPAYVGSSESEVSPLHP